MSKWIAWCVLAGVVLYHAAAAHAAFVIEADKAAVRPEGSPVPGGGWNLWGGQIGQAIHIATAGRYQIVVRAFSNQGRDSWPHMAMIVDGRAIQWITVGSTKPTDYRFTADMPAGNMEVAVAVVSDAVSGTESRNLCVERITITAPSGAVDAVRADEHDVAEAAEKREQAVLAGTNAAIEKNRKSDAQLRLVDASGKPLAGRKVFIELVKHEFLFGSTLIYTFDTYRRADQNAAFKAQYAELFNFATLGFYWRWYEPRQGAPIYDYTDKIVSWCQERGIQMKGHTLLWGGPSGIPTWSKEQPAAALQEQRVEEIMKRYRGRIGFWEVVNEPSHERGVKIDQPYRWARQADPTAHLIVNDHSVLANGLPVFFDLLTKARQSGVPYDGIGIQAHEPRTMRFPLDRVQEILDHYATLGKAMHITEFSPCSSDLKVIGSPSQGVWDEAAQADYAVKFYRVCFAQPAMRSIVWWSFCDQGSWLKGGGMLRTDFSPKPVYAKLMQLIHEEWSTRLNTTTDEAGRLSFRGFRGAYRILIDGPGGKVERRFEVKKDGAEMTIAL